MENKDTANYKAYKLMFPFIILVVAVLLILYLFFVHSGLNKFGNLSSYYLPIFSFGESEFPPLEF
jgi:hypothetical protein